MKHCVVLAVLLLSSCRERPDLYAPENPFEGQATGRLTFNPRPDHAPVWSVKGDSLYYNAATFPGLAQTEGMLLAVPREGGTAVPIMSSTQSGLSRQPWLAGLALSSDGNTAAFLEVTEYKINEFDRIVCPFSPPPSPGFDTLGTNDLLRTGVLRVRKVSSASVADDARLTVQFPGRTYNSNDSLSGIIAHPFHRMFDIEGVPFFRPSFSPDGTRVVFSDGLQLRLWVIGQATSTVIPNTADGITPAWSPDGTLIAFSKPLRGKTQSIGCSGFLNSVVLPVASFGKTISSGVTREEAVLMVVRPDGTGARSLGEGDSPTWLSDSKTVVAHRQSNLYRINTDTGAGTLIANTVDGFEPALSRDGKMLAFAKRSALGKNESIGEYDLWVVAF